LTRRRLKRHVRPPAALAAIAEHDYEMGEIVKHPSALNITIS
jgi:hypothetical protein